MSRNFNFIFRESTLNDSNNVLGLIAYSIYKNDKIKFLEEWKKEHPDLSYPTDEEINQFHKDSIRHIEHYKELAGNRMTIFMEDLISTHVDAYKQAEKEAQKEVWAELIQGQKDGFHKVISTCDSKVDNLKATWKTYAFSGIIGNIAFLIFLAGTFFILELFGNDLAGRVIEWVRAVIA